MPLNRAESLSFTSDSSRSDKSTLSDTLELVDDPYTREQHKVFGAEVLEMCKSFGLTSELVKNSRISAAALLNKILLQCKEDMIPEAIDIEFLGKLLQQNDQLRIELSKALKDEDFCRILCIKILRRTKPTTGGANQRFYSITMQKQATMAAWYSPYIGNAHVALLDAIKEMNRTRGDQGYANYVPIIQSSGTGKSRVVDQLASLVFTVPFNVREENVESGHPFPHPDDAIRAHLLDVCSNSPKESEWFKLDVVAAYVKFFEQLFIVVREHLDQRMPHYRKKYKSSRELAAAWREYLNPQQDSVEVNGQREVLYSDVVSRLEKREPAGIGKNLKDHAQNAIQQGQALVETVNRLTNRQPERHDLRIVLYFDEAHSLSDAYIGETNRYDALCSALNQLRTLPIFCITLSTNSNLTKFSPPQKRHHSARVVEGLSDPLQPPYTELPFDCLPEGKPILGTKEKTLAEVADIGFMAMFGRPLWSAQLRGGVEKKWLLELARMKLMGMEKYTEDIDQSKRGLLAALSTRLLLDFEPTREVSRSMEAQLVEANMRIAYSVPKHREYVRSGCPSEPILAEAAAQAMNELKRTVPEQLADFVVDGLIGKGEKGELVMRLLLVQAYDKAAKKTCERDQVDLSFSRSVHLFDFLEALFGPKNLKILKQSCPDNDSRGKKFEDAFKHAQVRFTHFARNGDESSSTSYGAYAAVVRGMAIQCSTNQDVIDCIVPVVLQDDKLCEEIMSGILIQVRNKERREVIVVDEATIRHGKGFFPKGRRVDDRPYITISMQLGVQTKASKTALSQTPNASADKGRKGVLSTPSRFTVQGRSPHHKRGVHPRYPISVIGYSKKVFDMVDNKHHYAVLLGGRDLLDEHPRQADVYLTFVRRLKPYWKVGSHCYDWIDEKELNPARVQEEEVPDEETFLVGEDAVEEQTGMIGEDALDENDPFA
ncbi:hypothetical protein BKA93DRAFT_786438 [Sparassis latifolia]